MAMMKKISVVFLRLLSGAAALVLLSSMEASRVQAYDGSLSSKVLVSGLQGPAGMAVHPLTGNIYVAEKKGNRISVIKGGSASPVISTGWTMDPQIPLWLVSRQLTKEALAQPQLNTPGGVAISTNGTIYVCESVPNGRLLEFAPDEQGNYPTGKVIPVPWIDRPFTWTDVKAAADGRLFLAGSVTDAEVLHFGSVLMRDVNGDWWVLDFGPFMNYSSICLSRGEDVLVICERDRGGLAWWDCVKRVPMGTRDQSGSGISADAVTLLANGAFVVGQNNPSGGAKAVQVPGTGDPSLLVGGLDRIGGMVLVSNSLYIADEAKGVIVEAVGGEATGGYLLQRTVGEREERDEGFKPRQARKFMDQVLPQTGAPTVASDRMAMSLSLGEEVKNIALIAGKIMANSPEEAEGTISDDPLTKIEFVIFFPGKSIDGGDVAAPSLSYFAAYRKSGAVEKTRELLAGLNILQRKSGDEWMEGGNTGRILLPVTSVGFEKGETGVNINLAFLGLGIYSDYYLRLNTGTENTGEIVVESLDGKKEVYLAVFTDMATSSSGPETKDRGDLMMVEMDPAQSAGSMGWLNIGRSPVNIAVGAAMTELHEFRSMDKEVSTMIQKKDRLIEMNRPVTGDSGEQTETLGTAEAAAPAAGEKNP